MQTAHSSPARKLPWLRWLGIGAVWLAPVVWCAFYRMPYDLRIRIFGGSFAVAAAIGLGIGVRRHGPTVLRAESGKVRWRGIGRTIGHCLGLGTLLGIPLFGLLVGCNGTFRSHESFVVDGVVASKHMTSGRGTTYLVVIQEEQPSRNIRLNLRRDSFEQIRVGDHYHEEFQIGLFGWPCR